MRSAWYIRPASLSPISYQHLWMRTSLMESRYRCSLRGKTTRRFFYEKICSLRLSWLILCNARSCKYISACGCCHSRTSTECTCKPRPLAHSSNVIHSPNSVFNIVLYRRFRVASTRTASKVQPRHVFCILPSSAPSQLYVHY